MDYVLFHSKYSPSSKKLFEDFPGLLDKGVCIDSPAMRAHVKKLHVLCVPTMIITLNNKIVDKIVGYDKISDWLLITLYRTNQLQTIQQNEISEPIPENDIEEPVQVLQARQVQPPPTPSPQLQQTSLDDLILTDEPESIIPDRTEPKIHTGTNGSTLQLAEALKKERDNDLETNNKKRMI